MEHFQKLENDLVTLTRLVMDQRASMKRLSTNNKSCSVSHPPSDHYYDDNLEDQSLHNYSCSCYIFIMLFQINL